MEAIVKGIISGLTISILIGPIFIALVDITISKGWRSALFYVFGILISDIVLIYLLYNLFNQFTIDDYKQPIGFIGGSILMLFGGVTFFSKGNINTANIENIKTYFQSFLKGVTINILNPFVIIWWMGIYATVATFEFSVIENIAYYFFLLLMVFLMDLVKIRFAYYIKHNLSLQKLQLVKKIAGFCLFVFGVILIIRVL